MKRIIGVVIGSFLALVLLVNVDRISHPRDLMGTWENSSGNVIYTFGKYGKGSYSNDKGEKWASLTWYKSGNNIVIYTFRHGNVNVRIETISNQDILYHPGYKLKYNKFEKKLDNTEETDFYDAFESVCDFFTIKLPD